MILISAALVLAAIVLLIAGVVVAKPFLVMWSIVVSVLSAVCLLIGALLRRHELFPSGGGATAGSAPVSPPAPVPGMITPANMSDRPGFPASPYDAAVPGMAPSTMPPVGQPPRPHPPYAPTGPARPPSPFAPDMIVLVIPGRRRFHRPGCRQLAGRNHEELTFEEAHEEGFSACTTCLPEATPRPGPESAASAPGSQPAADPRSFAGHQAAADPETSTGARGSATPQTPADPRSFADHQAAADSTTPAGSRTLAAHQASTGPRGPAGPQTPTGSSQAAGSEPPAAQPSAPPEPLTTPVSLMPSVPPIPETGRSKVDWFGRASATPVTEKPGPVTEKPAEAPARKLSAESAAEVVVVTGGPAADDPASKQPATAAEPDPEKPGAARPGARKPATDGSVPSEPDPEATSEVRIPVRSSAVPPKGKPAQKSSASDRTEGVTTEKAPKTGST